MQSNIMFLLLLVVLQASGFEVYAEVWALALLLAAFKLISIAIGFRITKIDLDEEEI